MSSRFLVPSFYLCVCMRVLCAASLVQTQDGFWTVLYAGVLFLCSAYVGNARDGAYSLLMRLVALAGQVVPSCDVSEGEQYGVP